MRMRFCTGLLVLGVCSVACSWSSNKKAAQTNSQSAGTDTNTSTGTDAETYGYLNANDNCVMPS